MSEARIRAVIDTQVFLRAVANLKSLPAKVVFDLRSKYQLLMSDAIAAEVRDVLYRPKVRLKFPHLTDEMAEQIVRLLLAAEQVKPDEVISVSRDPKDDIFLACAQAGAAHYIVSEDQDLLVLNPYGDIRIINVLEFFRVLEHSADEAG